MNKDYLAGFFDGEGCICLVKKKPRKKGFSIQYVPTIVLANTDKKIVKKFHTYFKGCFGERKKEANQRKNIFYNNLVNQDVFNFCLAMEHHLIIKKKQVKLIFRFYYGKHLKLDGKRLTKKELTRREKLYQQMKKLNKFGD